MNERILSSFMIVTACFSRPLTDMPLITGAIRNDKYTALVVKHIDMQCDNEVNCQFNLISSS